MVSCRGNECGGRTITLFRCEPVATGPRRCDGGAKLTVLVVSASLRAGRLGVERVGLIDDGGVMELWEEVSIVDDDFPETSSTL